MTTAAYVIIFFFALARHNARINGSDCHESECPDGLSCVDANNVVCNSEKTINCQCKPENVRGLIVTCLEYKENPPVYSVPIAQDGTPSQDPIWSYNLSTEVSFLSVDVDNILQQAYFYNSKTKTIQKNPNYYIGPSTENKWTTLHKGISADFLKLAVDWISHNIYWTDPTFKWIMVQSLSGNDTSMYRVLIHENLDGPYALALDPFEALLFWSDIGTFTKIEVSSLSGSSRRTLLFSNLLLTYSLAADYEDRRLYFVDDLRDTVETVTYEGADRKILLRKDFSAYLDIKVYKDYLYVADLVNNEQLTFINKTNGNQLSKASEEGLRRFFGIAVFHQDIQPSSVEAHCVNYDCEHICLTEKNGAICICKDGYNLNQDMKTCSLNNKYFHHELVYSNESSICIVDIRVLSDFIFDPVCVLETPGTKYMIMDTDRRQIIIANDTAIYWARVDTLELHRLTEPSGKISGMAWDGYDRNLYWTEVDTGKILRTSIESDHEEVFLEGLIDPRDILILPHDRLVYWISDRNGSTIESSNIDGNNLHVVLTSDDVLQWKSLSYHIYERRIYFLEVSSNNKSYIISCNLDGSSRTSTFITESTVERLDIFKGYFVVTAEHSDETLIQSFEKDNNILTPLTSGVFNGTGAITDIKIFDENNRQNETGPCYTLNGECEQICISNGRSRMCECTYGFKLAGDGKTCISDPIEDDFMLVVDDTHKNIYQISLNDESVQGIKAKGINPIYNPVHELIVWITDDRDKLFTMHLNATGKKPFPVSRKVIQFDVDYSTGNIYYASVNRTGGGCYISVLSPDGKHLDLLKGLKRIYGLVVYPSEGYMFYLHLQSLVRANMDGSRSEILVEDMFGPRGLTIDYKNGYLYWFEHSRNIDGFDIRYLMPDGTNHTLHEINETVLNEYRLSDLAVYKDYLFIAYNKQSRLIMLKISTPNEISEFSVQGELGKIKTVNIYSSATQQKNAFCSDNNGGCSTFCLPVPDGGICGCEDGVDLKEGINSIY